MVQLVRTKQQQFFNRFFLSYYIKAVKLCLFFLCTKTLKYILMKGRPGKMKVIKRDGNTVDFDINKIIVAIQKANAAVDTEYRIDDDKIHTIAKNVQKPQS